jgi:potassium/sodium efflux P-type ATPase
VTGEREGWFALSADPVLAGASAVAADLEVDPDVGLSGAEAARRLELAGPNALRGKRATPLWRRAWAQLRDPLIVLLLVAVAVSVIAWIIEGAHGIPVDAVVILLIIVANALLGLVQEARAADAVAALAHLTEARSTVLRAGELVTVPSTELVPGDILTLAEGDQVGADARVLQSSSLRVAEASLTGESTAVDKHPDPLDRLVPLGDRTDMVFKGTAVTQGTGRAVVTATGMATEMGAIASMLDATDEDATPLQTEVARLGRILWRIVIGIGIVVVATVAIVQGIDTPDEFVTVLLLGVSLAVAAVPEGLPAIMSVVLALGAQRMARRNAVVKNLASVETLGSASVICTDKTGTLTQNEMTIERIVTSSGEVGLTGVGYEPTGQALVGGRRLGERAEDAALHREVRLLLGAGSLANDAQLTERGGDWRIEGDPTEAAFLVAVRKLEGILAETAGFERIGEVPFSSERKMMSTAHARGDEVLVLSKGAPDVLLDRCDRILVGDTQVPLDDERRRAVLDDVERLSSRALRTLGVAFRRAPELGPDGGRERLEESHEKALVFVGVVGIIDPPRPEASAAIVEAHRAGVRVIMITGDHPATAARIAADLGIADRGRAIAGAELDGLSPRELITVVRETGVFARVAPEHKLRIVDALQADGEIVAMTGDGVNDAPALKSADIGIAMGISGTEVTKEAANMILADDNFATIVAAVREGRVIYDNIRKFLRYLLYSNMGEVLTVFLGVVLAGVIGLSSSADETIVLPLLATQILWINLVTDSAPALAMGVDPEIDDVMARAPRPRGARTVDGGMWAGIVTTGVVIAIAALATMDTFLAGGLIDLYEDDLDVARTAAFTTIVLANLLTAFNARSTTLSAFNGIGTNRWLLAAVALGLVLQIAVVHVPFLQVAFGTAALDAAHWLITLAFASLVLWVEEIRKVFLRRRSRRRPGSG